MPFEKFCPKCKKTKPHSEFNRNAGRYDGLSGACTLCQKAYMQDHYQKNKDVYKKRAHQSVRRIKSNVRMYILRYLASHPCVDCGEDDIIVLDFDHVRGRKRFNVCGAPVGLPEVIKEIKKCDVRCANCHRRATANRAGTYRVNRLIPTQVRFKF